MTRNLPTPIVLLALLALAATSCGEEVVQTVVFVDRSSCEACHRPLRPDGVPHGIEQAHPLVEGRELSCVECHGGNPDSRKQSEAHVSPGPGATHFVKNLTVGELDGVDVDYLRFINPGDFRVASRSCGSRADGEGGTGCHQDIIDRVKTNPMSTFAGELGVGRYRAGLQTRGAGSKSVKDVRNPDFRAGEQPGTVGSLDAFEEPRVLADENEIGPYQDLYFAKACMRCHLWSFGDNRFPGDFRSSGCTACHMVYSDTGLSKSLDPVIDKNTTPHPVRHELTSAIPSGQCMHCHYRGGRIGPSYFGYRESGGAGYNPQSPETLGQALHGHDADYYITDENINQLGDETPPDVHQQSGMHCIDCHTEADVHGDGNIWVDSAIAVEISCESCHGTSEQEATLTTRRGRALTNVKREDNGEVWLTGKVDGLRRRVTQIKRSVELSPPGSLLHQLMGRDDNGFSHTDDIACYTCHSAWIPTCFGCHVDVDMRELQRSLISGRSTPGRVTGDRAWVETDLLILMLDSHGKIAPSMPAEKMFFTATNGDGDKVIDHAVRRGRNGTVGMGQRTFNPHTIQRNAAFSACNRCHPTTDGANLERIYQTIGLGSDQFLETDGEGNTWALDRIIDDNYDPVDVLVGHDEPRESRPLPAAIINKMLSVEVEP